MLNSEDLITRLGWQAWTLPDTKQELVQAQLQAMEKHLDSLLAARREAKKIPESLVHLTALLSVSTVTPRARGVTLRPAGSGRFPLVVLVSDIGPCADAKATINLAARLRARGAAVAIMSPVPRTMYREVGAPWGSGIMEPITRREWLWRLATQIGQTLLAADVQAISQITHRLIARWPIDPARVAVVGLGEGGHLALLAALRDERFTMVIARWQSSFDPLQPDAPWDSLAPGFWPLAYEPRLADAIAPRAATLLHAPDEPRPATQKATVVTWSVEECEGDAVARSLAPWLNATHASTRESSPRLAEELARAQDDRFASQEKAYRRTLASVSRGKPLGGDLADFAGWQEEKRAALWDIVGRFPAPDAPLKPQARLKYRDEEIALYEVALPVYEGTFLRGWLAVPQDIAPGERRAAIHCQHGWQGSPEDTHAPGIYAAFAEILARRGYVTWAPQAHYAEQNALLRFYRKSVLWGGSDFGLMIRYHQRGIDFLQGLPFVAAERIGFYGLSYGGYTALWYGAVEERFRVVICSGHFNHWSLKTTDPEYTSSYMNTNDREMVNFGLLNHLDHGEFAALICPRPFMVEAGDVDLVTPYAWAMRQYARVRRLYAALKISDRLAIHWGHGGHQIYATRAFAFLERWLPARRNQQ